MLTFIVPVRHQDSVADWSVVHDLMSQTFRSLAAQDAPSWRAFVVANEGADLPELPAGFTVVRVRLPFRPQPPVDAGREAMFNAVRDDKGARIWAGVEAAGPGGHLMVADYDDFVSRRLAGFVAEHPDAPGWFIDRGFKYDGSTFLQAWPNFNESCGTSLIVRADLMRPPSGEAPTPDFIRYSIGSHRFLRSQLAERDTPLAPLPFPGAFYRVGHVQSSVGTQPFRKQLTVHSLLHSPRQTLGVARRLRRLTPALRHEFLGGDDADNSGDG